MSYLGNIIFLITLKEENLKNQIKVLLLLIHISNNKEISWHNYDKKLVSKISSSEKIMKICALNKICISIIRPTLIYGNSWFI